MLLGGEALRTKTLIKQVQAAASLGCGAQIRHIHAHAYNWGMYIWKEFTTYMKSNQKSQSSQPVYHLRIDHLRIDSRRFKATPHSSASLVFSLSTAGDKNSEDEKISPTELEDSEEEDDDQEEEEEEEEAEAEAQDPEDEGEKEDEDKGGKEYGQDSPEGSDALEEGEQDEEQEGEAKKGDDQDEGQKYEEQEVDDHEEGLAHGEGRAEEESPENDEIMEEVRAMIEEEIHQMKQQEPEHEDMVQFLDTDKEDPPKNLKAQEFGPVRPDQLDTLPMDTDPSFWRLDSKEDSQVLIYSPPDETKGKATENAADDKDAKKKSKHADEKVQAKLKDMPAAVWTNRCRKLKNPDAEHEKTENKTTKKMKDEEVKTKEGKHLDKKGAPKQGSQEDAPKTEDDVVKPKRSKSAKKDTHKGSSTDKAVKDSKEEKANLKSKSSSQDKNEIPKKKDPEEPKEIDLVSDENDERETRGTFQDRNNF